MAEPRQTALSADDDQRWVDALTAAALLAIDPAGLGGALLRARCGAQRELWLAHLRAAVPPGMPLTRVPVNIADERLLGGLDLPATLQAGRPVAQRGVLAASDGGLVLLAMAERMSAGTAARLTAVLDRGEVVAERDGLALRQPARIGMVALDEGIDDDEQASAALADRLAFHLALDELPMPAPEVPTAEADDIAAARARLAAVSHGDDTVAALCETAVALGVASLRAPWLALRTARAAAALMGDAAVRPEHAALAARLVLAPRATRWPEPPPSDDDAADDTPPPPPPPDQADNPPPEPPPDDDQTPAQVDQPLDDMVLEAALAALPANVLARLKAGQAPRSSAPPSGGRVGAQQAGKLRGRPIGARRGELTGSARLELIATLRAAAPWQPLRRREHERLHGQPHAAKVLVRRDDFHVVRTVQRRETTTLFVVDASGSSALHRLAEAKGAVELLLADCYVRRDRVALLAFRGTTAELILPPTRSLVRAKRALAGLPGGGGTPLASAIDAAALLTGAIARRGGTPVLVMLTDGRANIGRDGKPGRSGAMADALESARRLRVSGIATLLVDTSPPSANAAAARSLADALDAHYLALPKVDAATVSRAAQGLTRG